MQMLRRTKTLDPCQWEWVRGWKNGLMGRMGVRALYQSLYIVS